MYLQVTSIELKSFNFFQYLETFYLMVKHFFLFWQIVMANHPLLNEFSCSIIFFFNHCCCLSKSVILPSCRWFHDLVTTPIKCSFPSLQFIYWQQSFFQISQSAGCSLLKSGVKKEQQTKELRKPGFKFQSCHIILSQIQQISTECLLYASYSSGWQECSSI